MALLREAYVAEVAVLCPMRFEGKAGWTPSPRVDVFYFLHLLCVNQIDNRWE
jgi:hypothetical protein